jgi:hypothetical protein
MPKGGKREGAGRKPGSLTKRTREIAEGAAASGETPLEYMLRRMRDPSADEHTRADMAKAAAPYVHARISPVQAPDADEATQTVIFQTYYEGTPTPLKLVK